jgi:hypothetical protein
MKSKENLKNNLFAKHESSRVKNLNLILGGSTSVSNDVSDSSTDCTGSNCTDSTTWSSDSTSQSDSTRSADSIK